MRQRNAADADMEQMLNETLEHLHHVLPAQAPIRDFVHHNTLHGFQHLPFPEALAESRRLTGARGYMPEETFRAWYRQGRIDNAGLNAALDEQPRLAADEALAQTGTRRLTRREVYLAALRYPLEPVSREGLDWQIREHAALSRLQGDVPAIVREQLRGTDRADEATLVSELWAACLDLLEARDQSIHPEDLMPDPSNAPGDTDSLPRIREEAGRLMEALLERIGQPWTRTGLLRALTGEHLMDELRPYLVRHLSTFLDRGLAAWHPRHGEAGLYAAWRDTAHNDPGWLMEDQGPWRESLNQLPDRATDTIARELTLLGLPPERWGGYLIRLALELPGWSGMILWHHHHGARAGGRRPVDMTDYLAMRLVLERLFAERLCRRHWRAEAGLVDLRRHFRRHPAELLVRHALFNETLPEHLMELAERRIRKAAMGGPDAEDAAWMPVAHLLRDWRAHGAPAHATAHGGAWPLFRLAQHLGLDAHGLRALGADGARQLLDCVARLDEDTRSYLWLLAYEHQYREQVFTALLANHGRGPWSERERTPQGQLVFCMDDREEGLRRHLEEINPALETFGAAGFFNVPMLWQGLDDEEPSVLAPVTIRPDRRVRELPRDEALHREHRRRRAVRLTWRRRLFHASRSGLFTPLLVSVLAALPALAALASRLFLPAQTDRAAQRLRRRFDGEVPTRAVHGPGQGPAVSAGIVDGFSDSEQADRVQGLLRSMGLTEGLAPLVVMMGHGSGSRNNPHLAAYDCGACSGRHGGPNARVFCAMANRPEVRAILAQRGIRIPETTWFIGGEHNTCDDSFEWYDLDRLPESLEAAFAALRTDLERAAALHAQERCRRFASAPADPSPERAYRHVAARACDFSQARPELGHANNAAAFIGRRSMSRGAFFDRRSFLISYDPARDPDGSVLEPLILANAPVGAGINLEYYFSRVDNERYGCGTKVTHNISGLLGVMEGTASDLRTGLPLQMIEIHEPMRLLVVVEHHIEVLTRIYERQPPLQELIGNGWLILAAKHPEAPLIHRFDPQRGWLRWEGPAELPEVEHSADWFRGQTDALGPVLLSRATLEAGGTT